VWQLSENDAGKAVGNDIQRANLTNALWFIARLLKVSRKINI